MSIGKHMPCWINVKERLPEEGQIVVCYLSRKKEPCVVKFGIDRFGPVWTEIVLSDRFNCREDIVTHWMEIPEVPQ